jgi:crossover junction endodeoxyribonuclease RusA
MSDRHELAHEEVVDLYWAADQGPDHLLPHVEELVFNHRLEAVVTADLAPAPRRTTLTLEPPCDFLNANQRIHHHQKADLTRTWRAAAAAAVNAGFHPEPYQRAHITITYRLPNDRRREVSNLQPTSKAIVDGLVDAQLLPDDSDRQVVGPDNRREFPNGTPRVTITLEELPDAA